MHPESLAFISPRLRLKISKRARRIALRLDSAERVVNLVVPQRFSLRKAIAFAEEHREWISERLAGLPDPIPFSHGNVIPILGRDRQIEVTHAASRLTVIKVLEDRISVTTGRDDPARRIERYLKSFAAETLGGLAREKASLIGKELSAVQIRDTRSRWGSCGHDGRISLSWRLIFAPAEAMDYVVSHEVAHLIHMNHSKKFWSVCADLSNDFAGGKHWMLRHGSTLLRYGDGNQ